MKRRLSLVCLLLILSCSRGGESPAPEKRLRLPPPPTEAEADLDADNLLNMAYGASVISRTAEANLEQSAVHAVDGIGSTAWWSPPAGSAQTLVFSLATLSRIQKIGITTSTAAPAEVRFEASIDGLTWEPIAAIEPKPVATTQIAEVTPFEARYIRVSTGESDRYYVQLRSVHAIGSEIAPLEELSLDGCWTINGSAATFRREGQRVSGTIGGERPTIFEGASDGRGVRLMWRRGPMWGYALLTGAGDSLAALTFHEEIVTQYAGAAWFGRRRPEGDCTGAEGANELELILERAGRWSMFGLVFDERDVLDPEASAATLAALDRLLRASSSEKWRVVAHEYGGADAEENRRRSRAQIAQLRSALESRDSPIGGVEFVAAGSERNVAPVSTAVQRRLASRIDLEVRR